MMKTDETQTEAASNDSGLKKKFARLPVWYSVVSCSVSLLVSLLLLINPAAASGPGSFSAALFFFFVASYLNCLPLAIVSIFLFLRKDMRGYSVANFLAIIFVLYFVIKIFGKSV